MRRDGTVVEVLADGTERAFPDTPMRPMTDEEVHAAALADPDAQPLTEERLAHMKRVPRARTLRRALGLTQEEFAPLYIPVGTLRDWEQGARSPTSPRVPTSTSSPTTRTACGARWKPARSLRRGSSPRPITARAQAELGGLPLRPPCG